MSLSSELLTDFEDDKGLDFSVMYVSLESLFLIELRFLVCILFLLIIFIIVITYILLVVREFIIK